MIRRLVLVTLAGLLVAGTAAGPARLAAAVGLVPAASAPGFLPQPTPVTATAPSLRITALTSVLDNQPIPLTGGGRSPRGTVLLEFAAIELDKLEVMQGTGELALAITNAGSGAQAARIGGPGQTVQLWGVLRRLDVCTPLLPGDGSDASCRDVSAAIQVLSAFLQRGGKLPEQIRARNLDIDIYALRVSAPGRAVSLDLPQGRIAVTPR